MLRFTTRFSVASLVLVSAFCIVLGLEPKVRDAFANAAGISQDSRQRGETKPPSLTPAELELATRRYVAAFTNTQQPGNGDKMNHLLDIDVADSDVRVFYLGDGIHIVHNRKTVRQPYVLAMEERVRKAPLYKGHFVVQATQDGLPKVTCSNSSARLSQKLKDTVLSRCGYLVPNPEGVTEYLRHDWSRR